MAVTISQALAVLTRLVSLTSLSLKPFGPAASNLACPSPTQIFQATGMYSASEGTFTSLGIKCGADWVRVLEAPPTAASAADQLPFTFLDPGGFETLFLDRRKSDAEPGIIVLLGFCGWVGGTQRCCCQLILGAFESPALAWLRPCSALAYLYNIAILVICCMHAVREVAKPSAKMLQPAICSSSATAIC